MIIEIREEGALIEGFKPGYYGCDCCHKDDCGCPDTGDTPTPPGPEPPTPDTGITSIHIIVADTITDSGRASAVFTPATADTSLYFSSSDEDIAEIDPDTGEITVIQTGVVTFCVEDLLTGLEDCKVVNVIKSVEPEPSETGITSIHIIVEDTITDFGTAGVEFEPATADTSFVFSSSDENIAVIDPDTGEIEVLETGFVTFCVEDLLTTLRDCKTVYVIKSGPDPHTQILLGIYDVISTTDPTWVFSNNFGMFNNLNKLTDVRIQNGPSIRSEIRYMNYSSQGVNAGYYYTFDQTGRTVLEFYLTGSSEYLFDYTNFSYDRLRLLLKEIIIPDNMETIPADFARSMHSLTGITIGTGVTTIEEVAFQNCGFKTLTIPGTVKELKQYCFSQNSYLTSVTFNQGVEIIGQGIFAYCSGLTALDIVDSVKTVGPYSFRDCTGLRNVHIGSGVTTIGNVAFMYCDSIQSMTIDATTPPTLGGPTSLGRQTLTFPIYVPAASVNAYKNDPSWSGYANRVQPKP